MWLVRFQLTTWAAAHTAGGGQWVKIKTIQYKGRLFDPYYLRLHSPVDNYLLAVIGFLKNDVPYDFIDKGNKR